MLFIQSWLGTNWHVKAIAIRQRGKKNSHAACVFCTAKLTTIMQWQSILKVASISSSPVFEWTQTGYRLLRYDHLKLESYFSSWLETYQHHKTIKKHQESQGKRALGARVSSPEILFILLPICSRFPSEKRARPARISLCSPPANARWERAFPKPKIGHFNTTTSHLKSRLNFEHAGLWMNPNGLLVIEIWSFKTRLLFLKLTWDIPASQDN